MAFLLFAARKIQLKREINAKQYEVALIASRYQEATQKVADKQQAMTDMKNAFQAQTSLFAQVGQASAVALMTEEAKKAGKLDENGQLSVQAMQYALTNGTQAGNTLATAANSIFDSIVGQQNKAELARLQAQASSLETRKTSLETQLKQLEQEVQNYDQALNNSVKEAAPSFA